MVLQTASPSHHCRMKITAKPEGGRAFSWIPWEPVRTLQAGGLLEVTKSTLYVQTLGGCEMVLEGTCVNSYFYSIPCFVYLHV